MRNLAPIAFFAYNRPEQTLVSLKALEKNNLANDSVLHIFIDGPANESDQTDIAQILDIAERPWKFKAIFIKTHAQNQGLYAAITGGISEVLDKNEQVIVVEDDVVTAPGFLNYMNDALSFYEATPEVFSICGYTYPDHTFQIPNDYPHEVYFSERFEAWGWATWKNRWNKVDFNRQNHRHIKLTLKEKLQFAKFGYDRLRMLDDCKNFKSDGWDIIVHYNISKSNKKVVSPCHSFTNNIGFIAKSTHCSEKGHSKFHHEKNLNNKQKINFTKELEIHPLIQKRVRKKFTPYPLYYLIRRGLAILLKPLLKKIIHVRN